MDGIAELARPIAWQPQAGPQTWLLSCPVEDVMFGGARGGGKSDGLLGDWISHSGIYGGEARGIILRRTVPALEELWARANAIFPQMGARWVAKSSTWRFPNGSTLKFRWLDREQDADAYQGHQYTWIGADEAGTWKDPAALDKMRATLRSPTGIPCVFRCTANPGGPGHQWLKERYVQPAIPMTPHFDEARRTWRVFIPSKLQQNLILMKNDPTYMDRIRSSGPEWLVRAWLDGDWDASAGDTFFTEAILLQDGKGVPYPARADGVFAIIDTAVKTGQKRDGTACTYFAFQRFHSPKLIILDWEVKQIEGASQGIWLEQVNQRLEVLARATNSRMGNRGVLIEDQNSGSILIQQAKRAGNVRAIDNKLMMKGKDERAMAAGPHVYGGEVKISEFAYRKTAIYKGYSKNHFWSQVTGYRLGDEKQEDDALDTFTYGVLTAFADAKTLI